MYANFVDGVICEMQKSFHLHILSAGNRVFHIKIPQSAQSFVLQGYRWEKTAPSSSKGWRKTTRAGTSVWPKTPRDSPKRAPSSLCWVSPPLCRERGEKHQLSRSDQTDQLVQAARPELFSFLFFFISTSQGIKEAVLASCFLFITANSFGLTLVRKNGPWQKTGSCQECQVNSFMGFMIKVWAVSVSIEDITSVEYSECH